MSNHPVLRSSFLSGLSTDRASGKQLATIKGDAFLERAHDEALRHLVVAKMSDLKIATHHALEECDEIVRDVIRRTQANEYGAQAFAELGEEGFRALKHELRRLTEGGF